MSADTTAFPAAFDKTIVSAQPCSEPSAIVSADFTAVNATACNTDISTFYAAH